MSTIDYSLASGVATLTLTEGDRGNPIHLATVVDLHAAVRRARHESARVIVLRSTGRFFCVGGDLSAFAAAEDPGDLIDDVADCLHRVVAELQRGPAIVVSVVHGVAAGGGFPLAMAADVVIAARSAAFTLGYTKVGLTPDGGSSLLVHSLGLHRVLRLALLNDLLTAEEAHAAGLVARVADDEELESVVESVVATLRDGPATAFAETKRMLRETADAAPERALRAETASVRTRIAEPDGQEGVRAFLEKRPARFGGPR